jgi:hypothetical protein
MPQYRQFNGCCVPTRCESVWHQPQGHFVYGRLILKSIRYDFESGRAQ